MCNFFTNIASYVRYFKKNNPWSEISSKIVCIFKRLKYSALCVISLGVCNNSGCAVLPLSPNDTPVKPKREAK